MYQLHNKIMSGFYSDECNSIRDVLKEVFGWEPFSHDEAVDILRIALRMDSERVSRMLPYMVNKGYLKEVE